jgi:hypothetical protein
VLLQRPGAQACQSFTLVVEKAQPTVATTASAGGSWARRCAPPRGLRGVGPTGTVTFRLFSDTVFGTLSCTANDPAPHNAGAPNTATAKLGQCAGL